MQRHETPSELGRRLRARERASLIYRLNSIVLDAAFVKSLLER